MSYDPQPIDTSHVVLSDVLLQLQELLARNNHDVWAQGRIAEGWVYGPERDDRHKEHPCLVPYDELSEAEKDIDRNTAMETLKAITALGYHIVPPFVTDEDGAEEDSSDAPQHPWQALTVQIQAAREVGAQDQLGARGELGLLLDLWKRRREDDPAWRSSPRPYRELGQRFLQLGHYPLAKEVAQAALHHTLHRGVASDERPWERDVELRLILGLALARTANPVAAQQVLKALYEDLHMEDDRPLDQSEKKLWEETLGMLARTFKDQALTAETPRQAELWGESLRWYQRAYRRTQGYWTGINVATLARLKGDEELAMQTALGIQAECQRRLEVCPPGEAYWVLATLGEAALVMGDLDEAGRWYRDAYRQAPRAYGNLNSTRRHARWLLTQGNHDPALLDAWLPIPKVVIFSGHMIDAAGRPSPRFPPRLVPAVKAAIRQWLERENALIGFSSAACGADLLFQESLRELGGERHIVLPYETSEFCRDSVEIAVEGDWRGSFADALQQASEVVIASRHKMTLGGVSYEYANLMLHGLATVRARELETQAVGLVVWNGQPGDGPGGVSSMTNRLRRLGTPVSQIVLSPQAHADAPLPIVAITSPPPRRLSDESDASDDVRIMAMIFGDAVNYSSLSEDQVPRFLQHFLAPIAELLHARYGAANVVRNTWGDGLYLVFDNVRDAGLCALDICSLVQEHVQNDRWTQLGLPASLNVRLALHAGPVLRCIDPLTGQMNYTGAHVSRAARLEPKTPPGEVYASEAFAALAEVQQIREFVCEYVRQLEWAKHYGTFPTYVVRRT